MSKDLLEKIAEIDQDVADSLIVVGLTNDDLKELCYDALKEIIPGDGMKLILLRSRIWKVISQETEKATPTDNSNPTTKALVEKRNIDMVVCVDDHVDLSGDDTLSSSSSSSTDDKGLTEAGKVAKVVHLMKNVHLLFGSGKLNKSAKKLIDLIYLIKDHEDPEAVCSRRQGKSMPLLCLDKTSAYLICQGTLIFTVALKSLMRAVLALIGLFYVIDVDYSKSHELGLTMLHNLLFKDMNTPADLYNSFESAKQDYLEFKQNSSDDF